MPQGIVISLEILVIGMGDRGSKSVIPSANASHAHDSLAGMCVRRFIFFFIKKSEVVV
jgi:hypothetical protein